MSFEVKKSKNQRDHLLRVLSSVGRRNSMRVDEEKRLKSSRGKSASTYGVVRRGWKSLLFFFFFHTLLLSSFWTSRGHRCRPFFPTVLAFKLYRA